MSTSRSLTFRLYGTLALSAALFCAALGSALWQLNRTEQQVLGFIDGTLRTERQVVSAYAQGLQMGQALRNVVLDPSNQQAYRNFEAAQKSFGEYVQGLDADPQHLSNGAGTVTRIKQLQAVWLPAQNQVLEAVKAQNMDGARELLVKQETPAWREMRGVLLDEAKLLNEATASLRTSLEASLERTLMVTGGIALLAALLSLVLAIRTVRGVAGELGGEPGYAAQVARQVAAGDLTGEVALSAKARHDSLLAAMRQMQTELSATIRQIRDHARQVHGGVRSLNDLQQQVTGISARQSEASSAAAAAIEQLTVSISQIADHAREADGLAASTADQVGQAQAVVDQASGSMSNVTQRIGESAREVDALNTRVEGISRIVQVIRGVAEQTNLLALNAAIEAARAGEQGRGFSVVADEVRKLAEHTSQATDEIAQMIAEVQTGTRQVVAQMSEGRTAADSSAEQAHQATAAIAQVQQVTVALRAAVAGITQALAEQQAASTEIAQRIEQVAQGGEDNQRAAEGSMREVQQLSQLANALGDSVERFRTR